MEEIMNDKIEYITSFDSTRIPAIINVPDLIKNSKECIVLLHGLTTSKNEYQNVYRNLAEKLAEQGWQSVRFDFRGHGDSEDSLDQFNVYNQILDTLSVIKWVKSSIGADKYIILGTSFAASAGICTSYILQDNVIKLILLAPIIDFHRTFIKPETEWGREIFGRDKVIEAIFNDCLKVESNFKLSRRTSLDMLLIDPKSILKELKCAISILHGNEDGMVPFSATKEFAQKNTNIDFIEMPETGHGLAQIGDESRKAQRTIDNTDHLIRCLTGDK
jgi:pimeloyl-ACP methyl ester carboxylesterase